MEAKSIKDVLSNKEEFDKLYNDIENQNYGKEDVIKAQVEIKEPMPILDNTNNEKIMNELSEIKEMLKKICKKLECH